VKTCTKCGEEKSLDCFTLVRRKTRMEAQNICKPCRATAARSRKRSALYGITESTGLELRAMPCFICQREPGVVEIHIDHCHETGAVRGALCGGCNRALGLFGDSVERLLRAVRYVSRDADYRTVDREDES
jgi:protein-arginine kinase activator protein McsA